MEENITVRCTCECHRNKNVMHFMPCCDNGFVTMNKSDYENEEARRQNLHNKK